MSKRAAEATYRPNGYGISPSLARARAPFRTQNLITGGTLIGFAVAVWAYSISAVKQDNFDDIDFEAINTSVAEKAKRTSLEDEAKSRSEASASILSTVITPTSSRTLETGLSDERGLIRKLVSGSSSTIYPHGQTTLVANAPPIDRIGLIGDRELEQ